MPSPEKGCIFHLKRRFISRVVRLKRRRIFHLKRESTLFATGFLCSHLFSGSSLKAILRCRAGSWGRQDSRLVCKNVYHARSERHRSRGAFSEQKAAKRSCFGCASAFSEQKAANRSCFGCTFLLFAPESWVGRRSLSGQRGGGVSTNKRQSM